MGRFSLMLVLACFLSNYSFSQWHQPVFSDLEGDALLTVLRQEYKSNQNLSYAEARDTLYSKIINKSDSLTCIYTSYTIYLDPAENPRQDAFQKGLNAEHIWPRSLGAANTLAEADMHNLYSCRIDVNNDRGNLPFAQLTDNQTQLWYYLAIKTSTRPTTNKERYSRLGQGRFTPADHRKGDVARAMLYFYTMYESADQDYFELQRDDLCRWHFEDPVDEQEWNKTWGIAPYQEGKPNPFILDCTLAQRTYCGHLNLECDVFSSIESAIKPDVVEIKLHPNPTSTQSSTIYEINLKRDATILLEWMDISGSVIGRYGIGNLVEGQHRIELSPRLNQLPSGTYLLKSIIKEAGRSYTKVNKLIIH
jgi:hypothetical protein